MAYYLQIDQDEPVQIASLSGYGDLIAWVKSLPAAKAPALRHLIRYGWEDDVKGVISQLKAALKDAPPKNGYVVETANGMHRALSARSSAKVVSITDGLGPDDGHEDD